MEFKILTRVLAGFFFAVQLLAGEVYYEGTNTFRGYGKVDLNWMVQFLPYNPVILEAGAYHGEETLYASKIWPHGTIISFEPSPHAYHVLHERILHAKTSNVTTHNCALSNYTGMGILYCSQSFLNCDFSYENESSLLAPIFPSNSNSFNFEIKVPCFNLDEFCVQNEIHKIDVLNLNTDGLELDILQSSPGILKSVKLIILPSFFYMARIGTPNYFAVKNFLTAAHFLPLAHWYVNEGQGRAVYISEELYDAYFVRCLGLGLGGLDYP